MPKLSDKQLKGLAAMADEYNRLKSLSDRELVFECLASDMENEDVISEMMSRLYPNWWKENPDGSAFEDK